MNPGAPVGWKTSPVVVLRIIWQAFLAAVVIYGIACGVVIRSMPPMDPALIDSLRWPLALGALAVGGGSLLWRQHFAQRVSGVVVASGAVDANQLLIACVVAWAMSEAVALIGLIVAFLARNVGEFVPFGLGALLLLYVHRPAAWPAATERSGSDSAA